MEHRRFGPLPRPVPVVGQGTWYIERRDRRTSIAALRRGLDLGMTHIDTAEMYGGGAAEEIVGEAIRDRRDDVFLVSKVLPENASRDGTMIACERSLARLRTGCLDSYLLHWRGRHPLQETVAAFEQLLREGKIRSWGVSNFDEQDLAAIWMLRGDGGPVCNQVLYHLAERAVEHAVLPWCERHHLAVVAYSPFGHGTFPGPSTSGGRVLQEISETYRTTPRQVALRFLLRWPSTFAIPKAANPEHVAENAAAGDFELSACDIARIDAAFPRGPRPRTLPTL